MKTKSQLIAALAAAIFAVGVTAQEPSKATEAAKGSDASGDTGFNAAVNQLEVDLVKAMEEFAKAGKPDTERVKDFDTQLAKIDQALQVTADGGALDQSIKKAVDMQTERIRKYEALSISEKLDAEKRGQYEEFVKKAKDRQNKIATNRTSLRRLRSNLQDARNAVDTNKQFYIDAVAENELELAAQALDSVNKSMLKVTQVINDMKQIDVRPSSKPQQ